MSDRVKVGTSKVTFRVRAFDYPQIELASVEVDVPMYTKTDNKLDNMQQGHVTADVPDGFNEKVKDALQVFADTLQALPSQRRTSTSLRGRLMMISQYDKDMCCLYIAEGMSYIWQQKGGQELSRMLESLADRKLMKRVHGGYAITLKGLLAVKAWRLHLFLFHHHDEYKYFRRKK